MEYTVATPHPQIEPSAATPDTHVVFVGHAGEDQSVPQNPVTKAIELYNGESYGKDGAASHDATVGPNGVSFQDTVSTSEQISASSVALFACDSYNLASQYDTTDFTGVQSGPDGTDVVTLDLMAAAWVTAGGGPAGDAAANNVIEQSPFLIDTGDSVQSEPPKKPN